MILARDVIAFVISARKLKLVTPSRGRPFECEADATSVYIKNSEGKSRSIGRSELEDFCKEYVKTGARSVSHYQAQTFNASYLLALIDAYEAAKNKGPPQ